MSTETNRFSWGHININVRDLERSIDFYRKLGFELFMPGIPYLGFENSPEPKPLPDTAATALGVAHGATGRACIMQLDDGFPKLDLTEFTNPNAGTPLSNSDVGLVRICLATEDLARDVAHLKSQGVEFVSEQQAGHEQLADIAVCRDPDGTLIELLQIYLDRWVPYLGGGD